MELAIDIYKINHSNAMLVGGAKDLLDTRLLEGVVDWHEFVVSLFIDPTSPNACRMRATCYNLYIKYVMEENIDLHYSIKVARVHEAGKERSTPQKS